MLILIVENEFSLTNMILNLGKGPDLLKTATFVYPLIRINFNLVLYLTMRLWHIKLVHINLRIIRKIISEKGIVGILGLKIQKGKIYGEC